MCRLAKACSEYCFSPFEQKKNYDRVMKALDSITSIREMTQVSISSCGLIYSSDLLEWNDIFKISESTDHAVKWRLFYCVRV